MEASGSQPLDDASLPGIPDQRMLALVNTYIVHTSALLNSFATSCEERLQGVTLRRALSPRAWAWKAPVAANVTAVSGRGEHC